MAERELNRDIKKLKNSLQNRPKDETIGEFCDYVEKVAKPEFKRLYGADSGMTALSKNNVLIMLALQAKHQFIPVQKFGLEIEIENL